MTLADWCEKYGKAMYTKPDDGRGVYVLWPILQATDAANVDLLLEATNLSDHICTSGDERGLRFIKRN